MSRDLEQLLRDTAIEPSAPVDASTLLARGRRRRHARHAATAAGSLAVVALAAVVAVGLADPAPTPEIADQPPAIDREPETADDPETAEERETTQEPRSEDGADPAEGDHDGAESGQATPDADSVETSAAPTIAPDEVGRPLLLAGTDAIRRIDDAGTATVWDGGAAVALPDRDGGVVFQDIDGAVRWLPAGATSPPSTLADAGEEPSLHAVVDRDGEPTVLFTRRGGEGDAVTETLHAHRLSDGTETNLGTVGALESGLSGLTVVGDALVLSSCHLECRLLRVPWGADPEGDEVEALHNGQALPIQGLDAAQDTAAYVRLPLHPPGAMPETGEDGTELWLHDLGDGDVRTLELPGPPEADRVSTADVDLDAEASAALVRFSSGDPTADGRTLLVEDLDRAEPRFRWLDTNDGVTFASE